MSFNRTGLEFNRESCYFCLQLNLDTLSLYIFNKPMKKLIFSFLALTFSLSIALAQPTPSTNVLFILDASGSMWQKLEGEFKISIAKSVMKQLVDGLADETRVGLIAYGHNRKSDCSDIETLLPLTDLDKNNFSQKLDALNPQGMTPIAKSIQHATTLVEKETGPVTCILVSDGLETCDGDACALISTARAKGLAITMHVIGFGLAETDVSALECIAQAGGGQYFPANNAAELGAAMEKTIEQPPLDGGYLAVGATVEGGLTDVMVKVFPAGASKEIALGRTYEHAATNPRILMLPAGTYDVQVEALRLDSKPTQFFPGIVVGEQDTTTQLVDFSQSKVEIKVTRNGALSDAAITLYKPGTRQSITQARSYRGEKSNPVRFRVPPGVYDVEIKALEIAGGPIVRMEHQNLSAGASLALSHDFASGEIKIGAKQGDAYVDATITIISKRDNKSVGAGRSYQNASSNPKTFTVEPGLYRVELGPVKPKGLAKKSFDVEVTAGGVVSRTGEW